MNPLLSTSTGENMVDTLMFDPLITVDDKGNDQPVLAAQVPTLQNGGISKDGLTLTYKLRHNVKWHDGVPFTSADVKFTWQAVMNTANNVVARRGYDLVRSVDTPDPYTIVFHMKTRFSPAIETLFSESDSPYRILPKHLLAQFPNINRVAFNANPVGTGPFKFVRWLRGDHIELAANPNYFLGAPKIKQMIWKIIQDTNTQDTQMRDHEVDFVPELGGPQYRDLRGNPEIQIVMTKSPQYEGIGFNMSHSPLSDLKVRQALSYAIDKNRIMDATQFGAATAATEDISNFSWAYDPNVTRFDYNPAKAMQLLDADGWKVGPDGVRVKNGHRLSLLFASAQGSSAAQAITTLAQSQLKAVGVDVSIKSFTYTLLYAPMQDNGIYLGGKYDLNISAWVSGADPDDSSQFTCATIPPKGNNWYRFCNKEFDAQEAIALTHYDRPTRKRAYARTQEIMAQQIPGVFLFYRKEISAVNPDLRGFSPNGITETWDAYRWQI
ncbi:MAG: peptide ABC transporter substrate-binding protein [Candidatus Eremiobacteraeota bacterium]|nr:peptide ABC transporter substrate-binding protein [Candidatus Eremiobacteraeota bacterium]